MQTNTREKPIPIRIREWALPEFHGPAAHFLRIINKVRMNKINQLVATRNMADGAPPPAQVGRHDGDYPHDDIPAAARQPPTDDEIGPDAALPYAVRDLGMQEEEEDDDDEEDEPMEINGRDGQITAHMRSRHEAAPDREEDAATDAQIGGGNAGGKRARTR